MDEAEYIALKAKFLKAFAGVPNPLRGEIVVVLSGESYNWSAANAEILNDTPIAKEIINQLKNMGVI